MSKARNIIAIGAKNGSVDSQVISRVGYVKLFSWDGNVWNQLGYDIPGPKKDINTAIAKLKKDANVKNFADQLLQNNVKITVADARFAKPIDTELLQKLWKDNPPWIIK